MSARHAADGQKSEWSVCSSQSTYHCIGQGPEGRGSGTVCTPPEAAERGHRLSYAGNGVDGLPSPLLCTDCTALEDMQGLPTFPAIAADTPPSRPYLASYTSFGQQVLSSSPPPAPCARAHAVQTMTQTALQRKETHCAVGSSYTCCYKSGGLYAFQQRSLKT